MALQARPFCGILWGESEVSEEPERKQVSRRARCREKNLAAAGLLRLVSGEGVSEW